MDADVNRVAGVIVMIDDVVTVAVGLGSGVVVGVGLDQGFKEVLLEYGANGLAEDHLSLVPA